MRSAPVPVAAGCSRLDHRGMGASGSREAQGHDVPVSGAHWMSEQTLALHTYETVRKLLYLLLHIKQASLSPLDGWCLTCASSLRALPRLQRLSVMLPHSRPGWGL